MGVYREELDAPTRQMVYGPRLLSAAAAAAEAQLCRQTQPALLAPYSPLEPLQHKRLAARRHRTTYCYDFPAVFEDALRETWARRAALGEPCAVPPPGTP